MAGSHFMVGMGETEEEMCRAMQRVCDMGGNTHLFSFFPEGGSPLADSLPRPLTNTAASNWRAGLSIIIMPGQKASPTTSGGPSSGMVCQRMRWNASSTLASPSVPAAARGRDGEVACNRPYANSRPGPGIRNYPFKPEEADVRHISLQLGLPL